MKKAYRVKKNSEFQAVIQSGKSFANREFVIYYKEKQDGNHFRVGISVGKKLGNAVTRNRLKRLIREAFRELEQNISPKVDIIIIARQNSVGLPYERVKKSIYHLLKRLRLIHN
ncbi:MAG TPA: ribonuclease P protein component [Pseudogracilibacillus sp.]|nr:ribonuclease P protein component [Pseudogracilibacillus sp.]